MRGKNENYYLHMALPKRMVCNGEMHNMDSLACEHEVCEDVYIEEGGEV